MHVVYIYGRIFPRLYPGKEKKEGPRQIESGRFQAPDEYLTIFSPLLIYKVQHCIPTQPLSTDQEHLRKVSSHNRKSGPLTPEEKNRGGRPDACAQFAHLGLGALLSLQSRTSVHYFNFNSQFVNHSFTPKKVNGVQGSWVSLTNDSTAPLLLLPRRLCRIGSHRPQLISSQNPQVFHTVVGRVRARNSGGGCCIYSCWLIFHFIFLLQTKQVVPPREIWP